MIEASDIYTRNGEPTQWVSMIDGNLTPVTKVGDVWYPADPATLLRLRDKEWADVVASGHEPHTPQSVNAFLRRVQQSTDAQQKEKIAKVRAALDAVTDKANADRERYEANAAGAMAHIRELTDKLNGRDATWTAAFAAAGFDPPPENPDDVSLVVRYRDEQAGARADAQQPFTLADLDGWKLSRLLAEGQIRLPGELVGWSGEEGPEVALRERLRLLASDYGVAEAVAKRDAEWIKQQHAEHEGRERVAAAVKAQIGELTDKLATVAAAERASILAKAEEALSYHQKHNEAEAVKALSFVVEAIRTELDKRRPPAEGSGT